MLSLADNATLNEMKLKIQWLMWSPRPNSCSKKTKTKKKQSPAFMYF